MIRQVRVSSAVLTAMLMVPLQGAAIASLTAMTLTATAPAAHAQSFRFSSFLVEGNQRISDEAILTYAGIAPGTAVSAAQVNDALQNIQATGLFEQVEVIPRGNTLVIQVREYPTINRIAIEGNRRLDDDALMATLQSQTRRVYSPATAEQDAAAIAEAYRMSGRLTATVNPVIIRRGENRVDLVFEVTEGRVVETQRIAFVGNREYSDRRLRRVLESTQAGLFSILIRSDTFIEDRIALDRQLLTDFYLDRGYVDFEVLSVTPELSRARDAYFVTFNIREGQSFSFGDITVTSEIFEAPAEEYAATLRIREGVTYSPRLVDTAITRMENLATQEGLRFVRIEPRITRNPQDLTLDVEFVITPGERVFVERIDIEGNATTLDRVIRRQFDTVEGDPFDPRAVRQAAERIRATGFFADVAVEGRPGSSPDQVVVDVNVEEQPTGSLGFSLNYSTDAGAGFAVNFSERNFLGRGQSLRFGLSTVEGGQSFTFAFNEPNFLARDVGLGFNAFYEQTQAQDRSFDTEDYGFGTTFSFPASENGRFALSYNINRRELIFGDEALANSSPIITGDAGDRITSAVELRYAFDNRDTGLNPNAGVRLELAGEYAGLGGDAEYLRARALAIAERAVMREEVTLRATVEGGMVESLNGDSHYNDRFFLNSRQMRGFDSFGLGPRDTGAPNDDALGGNYFAVARLEASFPLGLPEEYGISGGVFYDIGSVWGLDNTAGFGGNTVDDDLYWRSAVGFSVFWDTALGPLRFNFSRALQKQPYDRTRDFDFTVETRF
ncbi:outer membrane protein assembly factor BamA [Roseibacterium sp. SDUM158017]|uniref:outer membrane protein assembly factor BamA n=1 Tax=Roseicyclus salinarum TaxID=3036773 RepID=UPI0024155B4D|nr:outer membrane protein assembly factor BamA [Roseibacterium sp. SDUM158017]MDG4648378.1 outer membrane protein assembly factor BamA [Roseibacterium sp. SDUM158017]